MYCITKGVSHPNLNFSNADLRLFWFNVNGVIFGQLFLEYKHTSYFLFLSKGFSEYFQ